MLSFNPALISEIQPIECSVQSVFFFLSAPNSLHASNNAVSESTWMQLLQIIVNIILYKVQIASITFCLPRELQQSNYLLHEQIKWP